MKPWRPTDFDWNLRQECFVQNLYRRIPKISKIRQRLFILTAIYRRYWHTKNLWETILSRSLLAYRLKAISCSYAKWKLENNYFTITVTPFCAWFNWVGYGLYFDGFWDISSHFHASRVDTTEIRLQDINFA